jgi:hypothetical protein
MATDLPKSVKRIGLFKTTWLRLISRAEKDGIDVSEAMRRAVWLYTMVRERQEHGAMLVIETPEGRDEAVWLEPEVADAEG